MGIKSTVYKLYHMHLKAIIPTIFYIRPMTKFLKRMRRNTFIGAEVGVSRGFNALSMLHHLPVNKMYLVDTEFVNLTRQVMEYNIELIEKPSVEAAKDIPDDSLDFVYIDASHEAKDVKKDIEAWHPKVKAGGVIGGHDFDKMGVHQVVLDYVGGSGYFSEKKDWWVIK